jgi:hypothetical protein
VCFLFGAGVTMDAEHNKSDVFGMLVHLFKKSQSVYGYKRSRTRCCDFVWRAYF